MVEGKVLWVEQLQETVEAHRHLEGEGAQDLPEKFQVQDVVMEVVEEMLAEEVQKVMSVLAQDLLDRFS
jgi:hypothetical protein